MELSSIGLIHTPFKSQEGMPIQSSGARGIKGKIVITSEYEKGLTDIDGFSHLILLYHFHLSKGFDLMVTPFMDTTRRGVFATRAPRRPNPIGLSIVRLISRQDNILHILDIDVLDKTPLIDIKPYVPGFDIKQNTSAGWLEKVQKNAESITSDNRFVD